MVLSNICTLETTRKKANPQTRSLYCYTRTTTDHIYTQESWVPYRQSAVGVEDCVRFVEMLAPPEDVKQYTLHILSTYLTQNT